MVHQNYLARVELCPAASCAWLAVSNAADRSRKRRMPTFPSSAAHRMSFWTRMNAVSQLCLARYMGMQAEMAPPGQNRTDVPQAEPPLPSRSAWCGGEGQIEHRSVVIGTFCIQIGFLQEWPDMRLPATAGDHTRG